MLAGQHPDTKFILMSGGNKSDLPWMSFLVKPLTRDEARAAVRTALAG